MDIDDKDKQIAELHECQADSQIWQTRAQMLEVKVGRVVAALESQSSGEMQLAIKVGEALSIAREK